MTGYETPPRFPCALHCSILCFTFSSTMTMVAPGGPALGAGVNSPPPDPNAPTLQNNTSNTSTTVAMQQNTTSANTAMASTSQTNATNTNVTALAQQNTTTTTTTYVSASTANHLQHHHSTSRTATQSSFTTGAQ